MLGLQTTIENLAGQIAASHDGKVTPWEILPFLPLSLGQIETRMDAMVDGARTSVDYEAGIKVYEFTDLTMLSSSDTKMCVCCGQAARDEEMGAFCSNCERTLWIEICREARRHDWRDEALWQHEMLFQIARLNGPVNEEALAPHSAMTLAETGERLRKLAARAYIRYELDFERNLSYYSTRGPIVYSLTDLRRNQQAISDLPAPAEDGEVEARVAHALKALIAVVLVTFFLAFVPWIPPQMPFMVLPFAVGFIIVRLFCQGRLVQPSLRRNIRRVKFHGPQGV